MDVMAGSAAVRMRAWSRAWVRAQGQRVRLIWKPRLDALLVCYRPLGAIQARCPPGDRIGAFLGLFSCRCTSLIRVAAILRFVYAVPRLCI